MLKKNPRMIALTTCLCFLFLAPVFPCAAQTPADLRAVLTAYTSGEISRDSKIRVVFVNEQAAPQQINVPLPKSLFTFKPNIEGTAVWTDTRTLSFQPRNRLPSGLAYQANLDLASLLPAAPAASLEFSFQTISQAFDIEIEGLRFEPGPDLKRLRLSGKLKTADSALEEELKQVLKAKQGDKPLGIQWTHTPDLREHGFIVTGILKGEKYSRLLVQWDGTPLNIDEKGTKVMEIPAVGPFQCLQIRPVHAKETYLELRFSDPLDKKQDLKGLIRIADFKPDVFRYKIESNLVQIYSTTDWPHHPMTIALEPGIRNSTGTSLGEKKSFSIQAFTENKPTVRFIGDRTVVPTTRGLTIPFETVNLRAVVVNIIQIHNTNIPQFLQVNALPGQEELYRVGSNVIKKIIPLHYSPSQKNIWVQQGLDMTPLQQKSPGGFYRIELSFLPEHIVYDCPGTERIQRKAILAEDLPLDELGIPQPKKESSYWDGYEGEEGEGYNQENQENYQQRNDPCRPGFYEEFSDHKIRIVKNVLISDIGLIAKRGGNDEIHVAVTDIRTAKPLPGVKLSLLNLQQQPLAQATSDQRGLAVLRTPLKPFLLIAQHENEHGKQFNYLKLDDGAALAISHFDVDGQTVSKGIKGFLYGERGVWRPGDNIYLTFILLDSERKLPANHPVIFELYNPRGQLSQKIIRKESLNGFYTFQTKTDADAPTGNWLAAVKVGGGEFKQVLKVETIQPNRLKLKLDFGKDIKSLTEGTITATLSAAWLHGAIAKNLKSDVQLILTPQKTLFPKYDEYLFDDPVRQYQTEKQTVFEGNLDTKGEAQIEADVKTTGEAPGMLMAGFETRVFEPGGNFSIDRFSIPYHPFEHYVGIRTPKGDVGRGMLLTDTKHTVQLVLLNSQGNPVAKGQVEIALYQINWRWWWEKGEESFANFMNSSVYHELKKEKVNIKDGRGEWQFEVKYPDWGRYMLRARDLDGNHYTGKVVYIDWPGWAGRGQKDMPGAANMLTFAAEKAEYQVGEKVVLTIPTGKLGRGLVSIENGTKVLQADWFEAKEKDTRYEFTATEAMAPNVYAHVTLLQPHLQTLNDLPIRLYGVVPIRINNPKSRITPVIDSDPEFAPESRAVVTVSEQNGRAMTYTLAVVDEGLLGLTRFQTPDPWKHFYMRDALGVKTWDIFDQVAGAYGGVLEQLLAIGGDAEAEVKGKKKADRFPPVVRFLGPFHLKPQAKDTHRIDIPQYVGSVRVMVVAGQDRAFGSREKTVFVRKPLMLLATLPRVLGPQEEVKLPVSIFALDPKIKNVMVSIAPEGPLELVGASRKFLSFSQPGDNLVTFDLKTLRQVGMARVKVEAIGAGITARQSIEIDVRLASQPVSRILDGVLAKNQAWKPKVKYTGFPGTNRVTLEVSRIPPLNLEKRLGFLIQYPHGCIEQTTSSVFPQVYLHRLLDLPAGKKAEIEKNVKAGIERLKTFQVMDGGFAYWPGEGQAQEWGTNYAGHFLVEAEKVGYLLPPGLLEKWKQYQRKLANEWNPSEKQSELIQAYRLYTLALAGVPELGAMNRLRETKNLLTTARWQLVAAYQMAGQPEAAVKLMQGANFQVAKYQELSYTFGSDLRDKAMIIEALCLMNRLVDAKPLVKEITDLLSGNSWFGTQSTAYCLIAIARHTGVADDIKNPNAIDFTFSWNGLKPEKVSSSYPMIQRVLPIGNKPEGTLELTNLSDLNLYPRLIVQGSPAPGTETDASQGISVEVEYQTPDGQHLNPEELEQGTDFVAMVTVNHNGPRGKYSEVALSQIFPSGWEIHNTRMTLFDPNDTRDFKFQDIRDDRVYTYFDLDQGKSKTFKVFLTAAYQGRFYMPLVSVEAMYDAGINACVKGRWIKVVKPEN